MKNNFFIRWLFSTNHTWIGLCLLIFSTILFYFFFFGPSYAFCQDDYVLANELIDFLRDYCPDEQIKPKNYWDLVQYLRADKGSLSGFTLLEHFTWFPGGPLTEDFLAAGIDEWAKNNNIFLNDLAEMRDCFCYDIVED